MSLKSDLFGKGTSLKRVLDGEETIVTEETIESSSEFMNFTPIGKKVVSDDGVITTEQLLIKGEQDDINDIGGGYVYKSAYIEGYSTSSVDWFFVSPESGLPADSIIVGAQLIQEQKFNTLVGITWDAEFYFIAGPEQTFATAQTDAIGTQCKGFFDYNFSAGMVGPGCQVKVLLSSPATQTSYVYGFLHYIEMEDLVLP